MTSSAARQRKVRWLSALVLLATFAAGSLTTVGVLTGREPTRHAPGGMPHDERPLRDLHLSAAQQRHADAIGARHRAELEAIRLEVRPKLRAIHDQMRQELRAVLTPEQRRILDRSGSRPGR